MFVIRKIKALDLLTYLLIRVHYSLLFYPEQVDLKRSEFDGCWAELWRNSDDSGMSTAVNFERHAVIAAGIDAQIAVLGHHDV